MCVWVGGGDRCGVLLVMMSTIVSEGKGVRFVRQVCVRESCGVRVPVKSVATIESCRGRATHALHSPRALIKRKFNTVCNDKTLPTGGAQKHDSKPGPHTSTWRPPQWVLCARDVKSETGYPA